MDIRAMLLSTQREGIAKLCAYMDENGFFTAPAATRKAYHCAYEGGLAEHTANVIVMALKIAETVGYENRDSVIIAAALHDLGKMGDYGKEYYVPNILKKGQSESEPYKKNSELYSLPHEIRSVIIARRFIELTQEEEHAIMYHNGMYSDLKYSLNGKEQPLQMIIHFADMWASRVMEG